jgi:hypothetical protein
VKCILKAQDKQHNMEYGGILMMLLSMATDFLFTFFLTIITVQAFLRSPPMVWGCGVTVVLRFRGKIRNVLCVLARYSVVV